MAPEYIKALAVACLLGLIGSAQTASAALPRIAIIIDDLGDASTSGQRTVDLPGPVACAFLPGSPHSSRLAMAAHENGKEILLHLPMQPSAKAKAHPTSLMIDDTRNEVLAALKSGLDSVPFARGVNNHQGSVMTQHPGHMAWLMEGIRQNGDLFFVDSYTSPRSVAFDIAKEQRVPTIRRDVFLDNDRDQQAISYQFNRLVRIAKATGGAVGIGHPYPETLDFLERELPRLAAAHGVELVTVQDLIDNRDTELLLVEAEPVTKSPTIVAQAPTASPMRLEVANGSGSALSELRQKNADLRAQLASASKQNEELARRLSQEQRTIAEHQATQQNAQISTLQAELASERQAKLEAANAASLQVRDLQAELAGERLAKQQAVQIAETLVAERDVAQQRVAALGADLDQTRQLKQSTLANASQTEERLRRDLTSTQAALDEANSEITALRSQTANFSTTNQDIQQQLGDTVAERDTLRQQLTATQQNLTSVRQALEQASHGLAQSRLELEETRQTLAARSTSLTSELTNLSGSHKTAIADNEALRLEVAKLNQQLAQRSDERESLDNAFTSLEQKNRQLETHRANLQQLAASKDEQIASLLVSQKTLVNSATVARQQVADLSAALESEQAGRQQLIAQVSELEEDKQTLSQRLRNMPVRLAAASSEGQAKINALDTVIREAESDRAQIEAALRDVEARLRSANRPRLRVQREELQDDLRITNAKIRALETVRARQREAQNLAASDASRTGVAPSSSKLKLDTTLTR